MSKKNLPTLVVSVEPLNFNKMETSKKKQNKSRQSTPVPVQDSQVTENVENNSENRPEAKAETSNASHDVAKSNGNAKPKTKRDKRDSRSQTPAKEKSVTNGVSDVALNSNGTNGDGNLLVVDENSEAMEDEALVPNSEQDNDELFPELIYDETSDNECNFDSSSPEFSPVSRSATRRSQAKIVPTPETPQMLNSKPDTIIEISSSPISNEASDQPQTDQVTQSKEKLLKMKEIYSLTPSKGSSTSDTSSTAKKSKDSETTKDDEAIGSKNDTVEGSSKTETNFSKSRVKISPYRRSTRISEQFSTLANYSGNNSTQETDIAVDITSASDTTPIDAGEGSSTLNYSQDSPSEETNGKNYMEGIRMIKGRKSYRPLRELSLRNLTVLRQRNKLDSEVSSDQISSVSSANATIGSESRDTILSESSPKWTPVGHVVGRKRRQSPSSESQSAASTESPALLTSERSDDLLVEHPPSKRQRLLGSISTPLRYLRDRMASSTPIVAKEVQNKVPCSSELGEGSSQSDAPVENQIPVAAGFARGTEEHKWCLIM